MVTVIDIPDDSARVNALIGGQVDAIDAIPFAQVYGRPEQRASRS